MLFEAKFVSITMAIFYLKYKIKKIYIFTPQLMRWNEKRNEIDVWKLLSVHTLVEDLTEALFHLVSSSSELRNIYICLFYVKNMLLFCCQVKHFQQRPTNCSIHGGLFDSMQYCNALEEFAKGNEIIFERASSDHFR